MSVPDDEPQPTDPATPPEAPDPDPSVDTNVISHPKDENILQDTDQDQESTGTPPSMPNIADLSLHSPSSMIVGTPFSDANSARFEYPFPDKASTSSSPELPSTHSPPQNSPTFSSLSSSPSTSALISASQPQLVLNAPPALQHFPASFPPPSDLPNYSATHPKMRAVNPPVPPALVKRRQRWTLGLGSLTRKISMRTGSAPAPGISPDEAESDAGHHRRTLSDDQGTVSGTALIHSPPRSNAPDTGQYT